MATYMCSRHELKVRFLSPAPIFVILVMICLCVSAGAYSFSEGTTYKFSQFDGYFSDSRGTSIGDSNRLYHNAGYPLTSTKSYNIKAVFPASGSASGSFNVYATSESNSNYFDIINPSFSNVHLKFFVPYNSDVHSYNVLPTLFLYCINSGGSISSISFTPTYSNFVTDLTITANSGSFATCYARNIDVTSSGATFDVYVAFGLSVNFCGFGLDCPVPRNFDGISWGVSLESYSFEVSNQRFVVPSGGSGSGSGGSVDLSSITSQINSLSSQMSASFNQVNANIDAAESSISNSIDNQTTALEAAISDAATDVTSGINDHFDSWDSHLSDAFSSDDGQAVVDANAAVSGVHQVEENAIEDARNQLVDVLDSYDISSDYKSSLGNISYLLSLLFQSCSWITDLIIFSCSFGIAFVLIGRKSRGSE